VKSSSSLYLSRLDHLRFLAALLVLVWHTVHCFVPTAYVPPNALFPLSLLEEGHTGVSLFMVLSGFIFMALCRDKEVAYADFLRNRVLRIAPLFLFWLSLQLWTQPNLDALKVLVSMVTMTTPGGHMPGVGWTILVEFQFYLIFPLLLYSYRRDGVRSLLGVLAIAMGVRAAYYVTTANVQTLAYMSLFGRIDQFVLGMLACEASRRWPALFRNPLLFAGSVVGWLFFYHQVNRWGGFYHLPTQRLWVVFPTLEGLAYGLWTACWLGCPWSLPRWLDDALAWMGKLSFSFYLNHMLVIQVCIALAVKAKMRPNTVGTALAFTFLAVLPLLTLASALTFYVIERPFLSLRRSYLAGPQPAEEAPARRAA
jgi:peptidoglycan/LPS O-acetylase OafA/YrhL